MASFKSQIEDIAGTIDVGCDAEQFLIDGVKDIIHRIKRIDKEKIFLFTKESDITSTTALTHQDDSVVSVTRIGPDTKTYICLQVPPALHPKLFDDESEIARDRIGEKPLYWTKSSSDFMFASEIKSRVVCVPPNA